MNGMKRIGQVGRTVGFGAVLLSAGSCALLENSEQYLATVAAEVIFVNIPTEQLAAYGVNAEPQVLATVAIGRLAEPETVSSTPFTGEGVGGAVVEIVTPDGIFKLNAESSPVGLYTLSSLTEPGLTYKAGETYQIKMSFNGNEYWSKFVAAAAASVTSPEKAGEYHAPGQPLTVSWEPASDTVLVSAFDSSGNMVYDNLPSDLNGIYQFLTQENVSSYEVPGSVFGENNAYGIGVAALERIPVDTTSFSTNLNHLISNAVTGEAVFTAVTTVEIPEVP